MANLPLASAEDAAAPSAGPALAAVSGDPVASPNQATPTAGATGVETPSAQAGAGGKTPSPLVDPPVPQVATLEPTPSPSQTPAAPDPATESPGRDDAPVADVGGDKDPVAGIVDEAAIPAVSVAPLVVGVPDGEGVTAPYAYWRVEDTAGNPVAGVTFRFQRRTGTWIWATWQEPALTVVDCSALPCTGVDRDSDPGEYLVKWIGSDNPGAPPSGETIVAGSRYRVRPATSAAPVGHTWVSNPSTWIDSDSLEWDGTGSSRTLDFGTFELQSLRLVCTAGAIYAVSAEGRFQQLSTAGGAVTQLATASNVSRFNGLGIGPGGESVYAFERSGSGNENATIWSYNSTTGVWSSTGHSTSSLGGNTGTYLVGGAVNPTDSRYYFGGYTSSGTVAFKLYQYNPLATPRITLKGTITTSAGTGTNGDLTFDAAGNLYLTRGVGTAQTVFTVTAADVAAAAGGTITPSSSRSFTTTLSDINGVALDASGRGILGVSASINAYDLPDWSNRASISNTGLDSTDLASCSFPPTLTIEKYVEGVRVAATDQFTLTLRRGSTALGAVSTDGPATGRQVKVVGPIPMARGAALTFTETAAGSTNLNLYLSRYVCRTDGAITLEGSGTSGTVTLAGTGQSQVCSFYNVRRSATVTVHSDVADANGQNPVARQGWTVGAAASATTGSVTPSPTSATLQTNASGNAAWSLSFDSASDRAAVTVSEELQDGYLFLSGRCVLTRPDATTTTIDLAGAGGIPIAGIAPGDDLACTYVNRPISGTISWQKVSNETPAVLIGPSSWTVQGPGTGGPSLAVQDCVGTVADCAGQADKDHRVGQLRVTGLARGGYVVTETAAPNGFQRGTSYSSTVTITAANAGQGVTFGPVVNLRILGTASWGKIDNSSPGTLLAGSEWELTGPTGAGASAPSVTAVVPDCVAANASACTGVDKDPASGRFRVPGLAWGDYSLAETKAPPGYVRTPTARPFVVEAANVASEIALGSFANQPMVPPTLPLTGGLARDFYTFLGVGVAGFAGAGLGVSRLRTRSRRPA